MDLSRLTRVSATEWRADPVDDMRVPVVILADEALLRDMDDKVLEQARNVACLPGIVEASFALPDAHWGYGFPIGGVAAFDAEAGGVVSAGGVGFDISCGVRTMLSGLPRAAIEQVRDALASDLYRTIPAGVGQGGEIRLGGSEMEAMLEGGAAWAVDRGYGKAEDLARIEEGGRMTGAIPEAVSDRAKRRQRDEMGSLGSGNHYVEVQEIDEILDAEVARAFGLVEGEIVVTVHSGSRGLGHQIGTEFLAEMLSAAEGAGIVLPDRELACAPIASALGARYLGAMRAGINCALANRQIIGHLAREVFARHFPGTGLELLFDVSHNTCKEEDHAVAGRTRSLFVHRKGATRAFGPGHPDLDPSLRAHGQPVLIGGSMGTESWVLVGAAADEGRAFGSAVHGAGRKLSRHQAKKRWRGRELVDELAARGISVRGHSAKGIAEEAPGAYKDVATVVRVAERAGLARRVARLKPLVCIKG